MKKITDKTWLKRTIEFECDEEDDHARYTGIRFTLRDGRMQSIALRKVIKNRPFWDTVVAFNPVTLAIAEKAADSDPQLLLALSEDVEAYGQQMDSAALLKAAARMRARIETKTHKKSR